MKMSLKLIAAFAIAITIGNAAVAQNSGYHILNVFHITSWGGWDYIALNPVNDNVYVAHSTHVNILNKNTGDSIGVIPNTTGIHGIAFAPEFKKGFTSNGRLNTVTVFDINTNVVIGEIKTGENPDAIMYDPFSKKIYTCNGRSKDLTVIDPATNEIIKTVELGGKPETAVSDEAGNLYINIEDKNEIAVVSTKTYTVEKRWPLGNGQEPAGLAIDRQTKRLFAGCDNKLLVVVNADNGKIVKELPIGIGCDGVVFDPELKNIFSSNGEGTLTMIHEKSANDFDVIENIKTKKSARTCAIDERTHKIYLPAADFMAANPQAEQKMPRMAPGTFQVLVIGK